MRVALQIPVKFFRFKKGIPQLKVVQFTHSFGKMLSGQQTLFNKIKASKSAFLYESIKKFKAW